MNRLKLVSLKIDDTLIHFKDGPNYIVGHNSSGKTTVFNCIKYVLGLLKSLTSRHITHIKIVVSIDDSEYEFNREVGSSYVYVYKHDEKLKFRAQSKELDAFLREILSPNYIYDSRNESVISLLDFCFLSEKKTPSRRRQWEAIKSICGINISLLKSVERDIFALKKEVSNNKDVESVIDDFSKLLSLKLSKNCQVENLDITIESTKTAFFNEFRKKEELLINASSKFNDISRKSDFELQSRIAEIEEVFSYLNQHAGFSRDFLGGFESFIKDRSKAVSYSEEIFSRFILVLAVAKVAQEGQFNFPQLIVNDSYLSFALDHSTYRQYVSILYDLMPDRKNLQYIEFTYYEEVPKEDIVLNMNAQGGLHVFDN